MGKHLDRFEVIEPVASDYLAVYDITPAIYASVESHDGGYRPRVWTADGTDGLDCVQLVASGERSYDREVCAQDALRLASSHVRLLGRVIAGAPEPGAEGVEFVYREDVW